MQAHAAAPGIFYVFREPAAAQQFLANRVYTLPTTRSIDPHALYETDQRDPGAAARLHAAITPAHRGRASSMSARRSPSRRLSAASGARQRLIRQVTDDDYWEQVTIQRRAELLIYIALSRFGRRPRFSQLGPTLADRYPHTLRQLPGRPASKPTGCCWLRRSAIVFV